MTNTNNPAANIARVRAALARTRAVVRTAGIIYFCTLGVSVVATFVWAVRTVCGC